MKWLDKLEFRFRRYGIRHLMNYLIGGMAAVYVLNLMLPRLNLASSLSLYWPMVMRGQVWRLVTFVFVPSGSSPIFTLISLYFYWLIGSSLESQWGAARFTLFYLIGMLGGVLTALVTGMAHSDWLNMSLFLAFAATYPDYQVLVFFVLPVKMKWLGLLNAAFFVWQLIVGGWSARLGILFSLANVLLFFGPELWGTLRRESRYWKTRWNYRRNMRR